MQIKILEDELKQGKINLTICIMALYLAASCAQSEDQTQATPEPQKQVQSQSPSQPLARQLKIVVTNDIMADLIGFIIGDSAEIVQLIERGQDAPTYVPTESDIALMHGADLFFSVGPDFELGMAKAIASLDSSVVVMDALTGFRKEELFAGETKDLRNPYIWFSSGNWTRTTIRLNSRTRRYDINKTEFFNANAKAYRDSLGDLDAWIANAVSAIPFRRRVVVTPHQGLEYLGNDYDIETIVLQEIIGDDELSGEVVDRMVAVLKDRNARVIFDDGTSSAQRMTSILQSCRQAGWPVKSGGKLYINRLGEPGTTEASLFGTVRHNVRTLVAGLQATLDN